MKKFFKIASLGTRLGLGGGWGLLLNVAVYAALAGLLWLGFNAAWNKATYANRNYKNLKEANEYLILLAGDQKIAINDLKFSLDSTRRFKTEDSLQFLKINEQHQINTQALARKNKDQAEIIAKYRETGKVCYEFKTIKTGLLKSKRELIEIDCP